MHYELCINEEGEVDFAVDALLREMRQGAKVMLTRMLHDEQCAVMHQ